MQHPPIAASITVCHQLTEEHRQLETLLDTLESLLTKAERANALDDALYRQLTSLLEKLTAEMDIHFACEERGLFPVLSQYHPMVLMEVEHEEIIDLRDRFGEILEKITPNTPDDASITLLCNTGNRLIKELRLHIAREDRGIFPMAERDLSVTQKQVTLEKMQALREEAKTRYVPPIIRAPKQWVKVQMELDTPMTQPVTVDTLLERGHVAIKHLMLQSGAELSPHWSLKQTFLFCVSGMGEYEAEGRREPLVAGTGILLDPRITHTVKALSDCHLLLVMQDPTAFLESPTGKHQF